MRWPFVTDVTDPRWIRLKGALFVVAGLLAGALLLAGQPTPRAALLLGVTVWSFCRALYFAFYVVQHPLDPGQRFSGLWAFALYCWLRPQPGKLPAVLARGPTQKRLQAGRRAGARRFVGQVPTHASDPLR